MDREYSYVTPENDFKQHQILPDNTKWSWSRAYAWVNHVGSKQSNFTHARAGWSAMFQLGKNRHTNGC